MKMSWRTQADQLLCRWSEICNASKYNSHWLEDASNNDRKDNVPTSVPDFTRLSSFGSAKWYGLPIDRPRTQTDLS
jgi:hypothetical protein